MASSINADNGVVSGSSGLKSTADTSGVLALQSNGSTGVTLDTSLNVLVGTTTSAAGKLVVKDTASSNTLWLVGRTSDGASSVSFRNAADSAYSGRIEVDATSGMQFGLVGAAEGMRLTSTGLGIGTSSPDSKLVISGYTGGSYNTAFNNGGQNNFIVQGTSGYTMFRKADSTELMRLDSAGNLGLGVTPSAWQSGVKVFEVGSTGSFSNSGANDTAISDNRYYNGTNNIYKTTNSATIYSLASGQHRWFIAPSGTAGNAITFTQAMTLDANGKLTIGASASSSDRLLVNGPVKFGQSTDTNVYISFLGSTNYLSGSGTIRMDVGSGGVQLTSGATSWASASDERLKDIIEPITDAMTKVGTLRTVMGKYKTDAEGTRRPFLIAQDVIAVLPEAVDAVADTREGDETEYLSIRYTDTIPLLVAAIKELKAELDSVKSELATLKGTP